MYEKLKAVGIEHCFLIGIGAYNGTADDICYDEIRNAQYSFAEHRKDITVVSRLFETMKARGLMKDSFHYYQAGYNEVGKDAAIDVYKRQKLYSSIASLIWDAMLSTASSTVSFPFNMLSISDSTIARASENTLNNAPAYCGAESCS